MLATASLADRPNNYDSPRLLLPHAAGSYAGAVAAPEPECRLTIEQALCCLLMRLQACSLAVIGPALNLWRTRDSALSPPSRYRSLIRRSQVQFIPVRS